MQKAISNKIQLGQTLNPADDYGGVPSINDEGTLENLISKVDKVGKFIGTGKADKDLSRYYQISYRLLGKHKLLVNCLEKVMQALPTQIKNNLNLY